MFEEKFNPQGLSSSQAAERLLKFGLNELKQSKTFSSLKIFFNQFKSPLIYILVLAGLVTFVLRHFTDAIVIFAAVVINTILGFYQEQRSQKSMVALRRLLTPMARVIRDGQQQVIEAKDLAPGDLVVLTIGSQIPADGLLVESTDLTVNEAILTGEVMSVRKKETSTLGIGESALEKQENLVFMGTTIASGIAKMLVLKTGMNTRLGKMGKLVMGTEEEKTPLQIQIGQLAKILALIVAVLAALIFFLGKFFGYETLQIFTISVAVAVAAIPEGLVITLTVILSLGMQRILKRKALVRQLLAAETLGSVSMICADKTGTLTEGKMRVIQALAGQEKEKLFEAAVLCNDMRDPLELTMMNWALRQVYPERNRGAQGKLFNKDSLLKKYPRLDEIPFNPTDKYIATLHKSKRVEEQESKNILFLSGAPEVVLSKCKMKKEEGEKWIKKFEKAGEKGYRLVGFAYKEIVPLRGRNSKLKIENSDLKGLFWLGILIYEDPIRIGVRQAFEECQRAGIKVKVITGDYLETAMAVISKLGIKNHQKTLEGKQLEEMNDEELKKTVPQIVLFARTTPEQKLRIVRSLKQNGEVVAMMGDGVNDAPALKEADIGIVVKTASDLSKETADMVLLDSNFATIVHAVEEGRSIFENIRKATFYLLSHSFMEMILISGSLLFRLPLPITAVQILWINLFQDSLPAVALAFEPKEKDLMLELPRKKQASIIDSQMKILLLAVGFLGPFFLSLLILFSLKDFLSFQFSQTLIFAALGIMSLLVVLASRSLRQAFHFQFWQNLPLVGAFFASLLLLLMAIYWPPLQFLLKTQSLSLKEWLWIVSFGFLNLLAVELVKLFLLLKKKPV